MDKNKKGAEMPKKKINFFAKTAIFIFIIFCAVTIFQLTTQIGENEEQIRATEKQIAQYEAQIAALKTELATPIDYAYVRRVAKSKLGYSMPDDVIFFNDLTQ